MKNNYKDILAKCSGIKQIANMLEGGKSAKAKENLPAGAGEPVNSTADLGSIAVRKKPNQYTNQYGLVSHYYKDGQWEETLCEPQEGKKEFLRDIKEVVESSDEPDGIRIKIVCGSTRDAKQKFKKDIIFDESKRPVNAQDNFRQMQEQMDNKFKQAVEDFKANNTEGKGSNLFEMRLQLLQKDFDAKLKEQQHQHEVNRLNQTIAELNEAIRDLENDLNQADGALNGLAEEYQHKQSSISEMLFSRVLAGAGENILRGNPKLLKIAFGLSDEDIARLWNMEDQPQLTGKTEDDSSFSSTEENEALKRVSAERLAAIQKLEQLLVLLPSADFEKVYQIVFLLINPQTGKLKEQDAKDIMELLQDNNKSA